MPTSAGHLPQQTSRSATEVGKGVLGAIHLTGGWLVSGAPGSVGSRAVQAGRLAWAARRRGWGLARLFGDDQVPVADRAVSDGELQHAVED